MKSLLERLAGPSVLILDGAMGTELKRRGLPTPLPAWSAQALIDDPWAVLGIHHDYVRAGADLLTTNTFRTTRRALSPTIASASTTPSLSPGWDSAIGPTS